MIPLSASRQQDSFAFHIENEFDCTTIGLQRAAQTWKNNLAVIFTQERSIGNLRILPQYFQRRFFVGENVAYCIQVSHDGSLYGSRILANVGARRCKTCQWKGKGGRIIQELIESERYRLQACRRLKQDRFDNSGLKRGEPS